MADTENPNKLPIGLDQLEHSSQSFWHGFTRFMLITTICVVIVMLLIAAFTVWS